MYLAQLNHVTTHVQPMLSHTQCEHSAAWLTALWTTHTVGIQCGLMHRTVLPQSTALGWQSTETRGVVRCVTSDKGPSTT